MILKKWTYKFKVHWNDNTHRKVDILIWNKLNKGQVDVRGKTKKRFIMYFFWLTEKRERQESENIAIS